MMMMIGKCVHCGKARPGECRCVSPFVAGEKLISMQEDEHFSIRVDTLFARMSDIGEQMIVLGDAFARVFDWYPENIFDRDNHRNDALTYYSLWKARTGLGYDPGDPPKIETGKLMPPFLTGSHYRFASPVVVDPELDADEWYLRDADGNRHYPPVDESGEDDG